MKRLPSSYAGNKLFESWVVWTVKSCYHQIVLEGEVSDSSSPQMEEFAIIEDIVGNSHADRIMDIHTVGLTTME